VGVGFPAQRAAHPVLWRRHMAGDGFSHSKKGEKNIAKNTLKILSGFPG
jgi:hypothetical protein